MPYFFTLNVFMICMLPIVSRVAEKECFSCSKHLITLLVMLKMGELKKTKRRFEESYRAFCTKR